MSPRCFFCSFTSTFSLQETLPRWNTEEVKPPGWLSRDSVWTPNTCKCSFMSSGCVSDDGLCVVCSTDRNRTELLLFFSLPFHMQQSTVSCRKTCCMFAVWSILVDCTYKFVKALLLPLKLRKELHHCSAWATSPLCCMNSTWHEIPLLSSLTRKLHFYISYQLQLSVRLLASWFNIIKAAIKKKMCMKFLFNYAQTDGGVWTCVGSRSQNDCCFSRQSEFPPSAALTRRPCGA